MKFAVLLSGCGIGDGSQIEEVMLTYLALDKYKADYISVAPNKNQYHTFNHYTETVENEDVRNVLIESARIGRGKIFPINEMNFDEIDALIIPGGQGVFKNLSDFIVSKESFKVDEEVEQAIQTFHNAKKPIGAICGAIVVVAKALSHKDGQVMLSTSRDSFMKVLEETGAILVNTKASECCIDYPHKVVSTPAFIGTQSLYEMMLGIDELVKNLINLHEMK